ncbi:dead box ATP-dependent RNA helicase, putative [Ricinus communis]|uniref:ATP-dependent RNA helicase n=1 Tax=Ricinus communis TaxID=3988 RepID=B9SAD3_RICCO|nr:dead box ATP-dependent RNA helicase, putative [Ricinus communis]|eukprot:XP_002522952.1 DEAD-box ATP-dependent RNA helicase 32 isoform X1 [Ricinus communis]
MRKPKSKSREKRKQRRNLEQEEIALLNDWIESQKPDSGSNPLSLPENSPIGRLPDGTFSRYAGCTKFKELPLSKRTKDGLTKAGYITMTEIQRASLPHSLCGRDILGAAKTGSGKTLAFVIPVLEKLHRERWGPQDGVGSIIISPTRELAGQLFDVLRNVGKFHNFSAGLLIGGRKDIDTEKESVNELNILVCTPGRLLQHMDETPNFDCSQLQVLVLDEADRILDVGFKKTLNAIISQIPKYRQTLLFSATQTKSVQDLARLSLKDPEYVGVHEKSDTATPNRLQQTAMVVPLEQKLDMLWSFIKAHLNSNILVFLSSCKQVKFVYEAFKKLHPGIPLKCLHGRMKQGKRMVIYSQFCEQRSVLFSTDVAARGLDFNKAVDWVVQVDCPEDVASYIHRVGRTARYQSGGRSVLFLLPSEMKMLEKLQEAKVPIQFIKANAKRLQPVSGLLSALLVKNEDLQKLAIRAFITYLRSIYIQKDKEVFDVMKLSIDEYSASLGLPMTPKIRFLNQKMKGKKISGNSSLLESDNSDKDDAELAVGRFRGEILGGQREKLDIGDSGEENVDKGFLLSKDTEPEGEANLSELMPATRVLKKKKLKINIHRPVGTRVVFDEEGNTLPPLARVADAKNSDNSCLLDQGQREEHYKKAREALMLADKEDKLLDRQRRREKRTKEKMKRKKQIAEEEEDIDDDISGSEEERAGDRKSKRSKIYFNSDSDDGETKEKGDNVVNTNSISLAEQEALALKLLSSMH